MTNRMDTNPRRVPDRRRALIILLNDLKMLSRSLGVCAQDAGELCCTDGNLFVFAAVSGSGPSDTRSHTQTHARTHARTQPTRGTQPLMGP